MSRQHFQFVASDAWLLLAIILAAGNDGANLEEILAAGDAINDNLPHETVVARPVKRGVMINANRQLAIGNRK
jgi:hypothetical protein